jgi:hypothetical protein
LENITGTPFLLTLDDESFAAAFSFPFFDFPLAFGAASGFSAADF